MIDDRLPDIGESTAVDAVMSARYLDSRVDVVERTVADGVVVAGEGHAHRPVHRPVLGLGVGDGNVVGLGPNVDTDRPDVSVGTLVELTLSNDSVAGAVEREGSLGDPVEVALVELGFLDVPYDAAVGV